MSASAAILTNSGIPPHIAVSGFDQQRACVLVVISHPCQRLFGGLPARELAHEAARQADIDPDEQASRCSSGTTVHHSSVSTHPPPV